MTGGGALATQLTACLAALSLMVLAGLSKRRLQLRPPRREHVAWWQRLWPPQA